MPPDVVPALLLYPDDRLRQTCKVVPANQFSTDRNSELRQMLQRLAATMIRHSGYAIAAPQVGILQRVIVLSPLVRGLSLTSGDPIALINPVIESISNENQTALEGCLSFPSVSVRVERPSWIVVKAQNPSGKGFEMRGIGLVAQALCHELEHLDGKLLIDHAATWVKRKQVETKVRKFRQRLERVATRGKARGKAR